MSLCVHVWYELLTFRHDPCMFLKSERLLKFYLLNTVLCSFVEFIRMKLISMQTWMCSDVCWCYYKRIMFQCFHICWGGSLMNALWYGISWQKLQTFSQEALASVVSALLSDRLSLSVPRPTNLVLEAPNPIIAKLTVNTQVSYPYWPTKNANIYCTGVERRRWRPCCRCRSYSSISPCEDIRSSQHKTERWSW